MFPIEASTRDASAGPTTAAPDWPQRRDGVPQRRPRRWRRGIDAAGLAAVLIVCLGGCKGSVVPEDGAAGSTGTAGAGGATMSTASGAGGTGGSQAGAGGTGGVTGPAGCTSDADCFEDPNGPLCDFQTGTCVSCIPVDPPEEDCGIGQWCNQEIGQCAAGCSGDPDCPPGQLCDLGQHACVQCVTDAECAPGSVCISGQCTPGCGPDQPCPPGLSCCGDVCHDLSSEAEACGACGNVCETYPHSLPPACSNGQCVFSGCAAGWADCDLALWNGCERNELADGSCTCAPGEAQVCYTGMPGTEGVGPCHVGTRTCDPAGSGWGPCEGQVLPAAEQCDNGVDDDCDGQIDVATDLDGDGWTACEGDCNDFNARVNPGAFEDTWGVDLQTGVLTEGIGNGLDDDCDPATPDSGIVTCDDGEVLSGVTPLGLARAMDLCQTASANVPKAQQRWGVLSAELVRADGTAPSAAQLADMQDVQTATLAAYGVVVPQRGASMAGFSTGKMRAPSHADHAPPSPGTDLGWTGSPPAAYLQAHNGELPGSAGCSGACPTGADADDGVSLRLVVRTPTNANGFAFRYNFFTAEYPASVCAAKNDYFFALETTLAPFLPLDKNIAYDALGSPVSVDNAFFASCAPFGCFLCPLGADGLAGTGMPASTDWLSSNAPTVVGETITLDLTVFDVSDGAGDSVVLVDAFRWFPYVNNSPSCAVPFTPDGAGGLPPGAIGTQHHCLIR